MIILRMSGGLGNQMFQYALYLQLVALGREVRIDDTTEYTTVTDDGRCRERRPRMLGTAFGIDYPRATAGEITEITDADPGLLSKVRRRLAGRHSQEIRDEDFVYDPAFLERTEGYYCGCFQSERYFRDIAGTVRRAYTFIEDDVTEIAGNSCAVHLRFGDYLDNPDKYGGICTAAYYDAAIAYIMRVHPQTTFYVFSNDAGKAAEWAAGRTERIELVQGNDEDHGYRDLQRMSRCRDFIIANSSFSWWGAWLGRAADKVIVAPSYWVREQDGSQLQRQDIYTEDMVRINPDGVVLEKADMEDRHTSAPQVSVIVAAYNIEQYLPRALNSLIHQTLDDLEIVVVDDGSTDRTPQIADEYAGRDPRIKVVHKENGGLSDARNAGLKVATGQYIGFVDGDDWVEPAMYESMLEGCLRSGAPMACVKYNNVTDTGEAASADRNQTLFTVAANANAAEAAESGNAGDAGVNTTDTESGHAITVEAAIDQCIVLRQEQALDVYVSNGLNGNEERVIIFNSVWSKLFRRDLIEGLSFPKGKNSEDIMWTTRCLCKAEAVCYFPIRFYNYLTDRKDSIMNVQRGERRLNDEIPFWLEHIACLREKGFDDAADKAEYYFYRRMLFYATDFHAHEGMESYARDIERMMQGHASQIMDVMTHASYGSSGDVSRMRLFLKRPEEYYKMAGLYERTVVALKNL